MGAALPEDIRPEAVRQEGVLVKNGEVTTKAVIGAGRPHHRLRPRGVRDNASAGGGIDHWSLNAS